MSSNTSIVTAFLEILDRHDWPAAMELVAPTARVLMGGQRLDREGWRAAGTAFYAAMPDAKHIVHRLIEGGDHVTAIATFSGTHTGELMGVPPTGRAVSTDLILVYRLVDGHIVEHFGQFDSAGLMQQLAAPARDLVSLATEWYRRVDAKNVAKLFELAAPEFTFSMGIQKLARDGYTAVDKMFFSAFPDGRHATDELVAVGSNRVLARGRFLGTHSGAPFQGIPPANKKIEAGYVSLVTFAADGMVLSVEALMDSAALMQQLA